MKLFIFLLIFTACSSTKNVEVKREDVQKSNESLLADFNIDEKVIEKFNTPPESEVIEEKHSKPEIQKPIKKPLPEKKFITPKQSIKKEEKKDSIYPENFPEKLKKFDVNTENFWKNLNPVYIENETLVLDIGYLGVSTGTIEIKTMPKTKVNNLDVYHYHAEIHTADFYSYLYEVHDFCDSYLDVRTMNPVKFSLIQRQSSQDVDALQLFDQSKMEVVSLYKRVSKEKDTVKKKKREKSIPLRYQDPFSVFQFLRALPLKVGDHYEIPVVNKGDVELIVIDVEGIEDIKSILGTKQSIKITALSKHKSKRVKSAKMFFWYTNDEKRILLKFQADTKIGKVDGTLKEYDS